MYVKLNGEMVYLWRAVNHEGEILESYITKKRDKTAALVFLKKALKRHGCAEEIVTDGLRSYPAAMRELGNLDRREMGRWSAFTRFLDDGRVCITNNAAEAHPAPRPGSCSMRSSRQTPSGKPGTLQPAMAAGVTDRLWSLADVIAKIDELAPAPKARGPYRQRENSN